MRLKAIVPIRARTYVRAQQLEWHRAVVLRRCLRELARNPRGSERLWRDLVYAWGQGWSVHSDYLEAMATAASAEPGPVLECGSGLTTVVLATIARQTGSRIWTLEHDPDWFRVVESKLRRFKLDADMRLSPLRDYVEFDWYDVDPSRLPVFRLVVCDGPPGWIRGGRVGLIPVLRERLASHCKILLDDAARPGEQQVLSRWRSEVPLRYEIRGTEKPFADVELLI